MTRFGPPLVTVANSIPPLSPPKHAHYNGFQLKIPLAINHIPNNNLSSSSPTRKETSAFNNSLENLKKYTQSQAMAPRAAAIQGESRDHNLVFGRDVIQVPLKTKDQQREYVNLVLSHREFDVMAVHIPQYDEMRPTDLIEEITRLLKELNEKQKLKRASLGNQSLEICSVGSDASALFQARVLELEYEVSRLTTKLAAARALHSSLTDENMLVRSNLREMEERCVDAEKHRLQNEVLREQAVALFTENAKLRHMLIQTQDDLQTIRHDVDSLKNHVDDNQNEMAEFTDSIMKHMLTNFQQRELVLQASYREEKKERQLMAEKYYEISGRIRVFCRLRPPNTRDMNGTVTTTMLRPKPNTLVVEKNAKEFTFDEVFGSESSQADVYSQMEPVVVSFADGFNACIMAYGQTGSGKTYTMVGDASDQGMIPRALQQVFAIVHARKLTYKDSLCVSMVEIYNDQILDLLASAGPKIKSETDRTSRTVTAWEQVHEVLAEGNANRNIAATSMNVESSRSHALVFLQLESQHRETLEIRKSTLCLVDLAGSERVSRSQVEGDRLRETQHINKSLSALGDVMHALQHKAKHVPYRNSKLTYMLRDMLSGQAKTLMMLQLSPDEEDIEETICSLQFGARVSQIQMGAVRASVESGELFKLKEENRMLERKAMTLEDQVATWKANLNSQQKEYQDVQARNQQLETEIVRYKEAVMMAKVTSRTNLSEEGLPPMIPSSPTNSLRSNKSVTSTVSAPPSMLPKTRTILASSALRSTRSTVRSNLTEEREERLDRRQSLSSSDKPLSSATQARLARAISEPLTEANRRATLPGSVATAARSGSRIPSPSTRISRSRAGSANSLTTPVLDRRRTARSPKNPSPIGASWR